MADAEAPETALVPVKRESTLAARRARELNKAIDKVTARAMATVAGLYEEPTLADGTPNKKYNTDAGKPYLEASTKTRVSVEVYKQTMAARRDDVQAQRELGVILLKERMREGDWEKHAQQVEESSRVIDVVPK